MAGDSEEAWESIEYTEEVIDMSDNIYLFNDIKIVHRMMIVSKEGSAEPIWDHWIDQFLIYLDLNTWFIMKENNEKKEWKKIKLVEIK